MIPYNKFLYIKIFLGLFWVGVHLYLSNKLGVKIVYDSRRYLDYAQFIINHGIHFSGHSARYLGYSFILTLVHEINNNYALIVVLQSLVSGLAIIALYKITRYLTLSETAASMVAFFCIAWVELPSWNFYIMTESLFISFYIFAFYLLLFSHKWWQYLVCVFVLAYLLILRPNGFIPSMAATAYLVRKLWLEHPVWRKYLVAGTVSFLATIIILLNNYLLTTFKIIEVYKRGDIIFGYYNLLIYPDSTRVSTTPYPLLNIIIFLIKNLAYLLKAGSLKVFYFFAHIKPFYSFFHNLFVIATLLPVYVFAFRAKLSFKPSFLFIYTLIFLQTAMVFLTTEDWDGRFLMPILPFILLLSACGLGTYEQIKE